MSLVDLQPVVDRVKARAPLLRSVGVAADLAEVMKPGAIIAGPMAFVLEMGARPVQITEGSGPLRQSFDVTLTVVTGLPLRGMRSEQAIKAMAQPLRQIRFALFGWRHPDAERKTWCDVEQIEDLDGERGVLLYRQDFTTQIRIQEENP